MKRCPDVFGLSIAASIVIALTVIACGGKLDASSDPDAGDAGWVSDAGRDAGDSPATDGGDGGADASDDDAEPDSGPDAGGCPDADPCDDGCDLAACPETLPQFPEYLKCCRDGQCGLKRSVDAECYLIEPDTCGLASCPEPTYPGFFKCCNSDNECSFKNGHFGFCSISDSSNPENGGGGSGGGMP